MSRDLARAGEQHFASAARYAIAGLDTQDVDDPLFDLRWHPAFMQRTGYVLGLKAVRSIDELAHMPAAQVRPLLFATLSKSASRA